MSSLLPEYLDVSIQPQSSVKGLFRLITATGDPSFSLKILG